MLFRSAPSSLTGGTATAQATVAGDFSIDFVSSMISGAGTTTSSTLDVYINGVDHHYAFADLASAQAFFNNDTIDYGIITGGVYNVSMDYSLTSNTIGDGIAFNYGFDYTAVASPAPEAGKGVLALALLVLAGALTRARGLLARG